MQEPKQHGRTPQLQRMERSKMTIVVSSTLVVGQNSVAPREGKTTFTALPLICRLCRAEFPASPSAICENCLGPLEPLYNPGRTLPTREEIAGRDCSIWRYQEWLPFEGEVQYSRETGFTPLLDAPRLAARLGVRKCWVKNDAVSHPSLSFKDRVVAAAINAAASFGLDTIGCASTGNLANAVAAHAARAGFKAWIFIPESLERAKILASLVYGANVVRVRGHYDDVNRLCSQVSDHFGWGVVNVNLRSYYGEGSKSMAFEIAEQLGWRLPTAVVAPMAGGSLVTKLHKGFGEFIKAGLVDGSAPRLFGAQALGCSPIVNAVRADTDQVVPVVPDTIARSLAIGNPADGLFASHVLRSSGGYAAAVSDDDLVSAIRLLAADSGVFTETAGGVTLGAALRLAAEGRFNAEDELVLCITGNGLKTIDAIESQVTELPVINARMREVRDLVGKVA
jgi:threonine synthase